MNVSGKRSLREAASNPNVIPYTRELGNYPDMDKPKFLFFVRLVGVG